nr:Retrovirus-related Pol polyprotein from transposon TNT 1-94 [Ipomoea batatas]
MLIASPNMSLVEKLKSQLSNEFGMKDLGVAKKILGMEIHRDRKAGKLYLSQKKYVEKVLDRFNMSNCKPVSTPLGAHFKLSSDSCPKSDVDVVYMSKVPYSSVVGSLIWKATFQSIVELSTTEAEYIAATEGVKEATWLRGLVMELGVSQGLFHEPMPKWLVILWTSIGVGHVIFLLAWSWQLIRRKLSSSEL